LRQNRPIGDFLSPLRRRIEAGPNEWRLRQLLSSVAVMTCSTWVCSRIDMRPPAAAHQPAPHRMRGTCCRLLLTVAGFDPQIHGACLFSSPPSAQAITILARSASALAGLRAPRPPFQLIVPLCQVSTSSAN